MRGRHCGYLPNLICFYPKDQGYWVTGQDPIVRGSIPECVAGKPKCVAGRQVCVARDDALGYPDELLTFLILDQIKCVACAWLVSRSAWPVRKCAWP